MNSIRIANPIPGGQSYTSIKRATEFVRRGLAMIVDDKLWFMSASPADIHRMHMEEKRMREAAGMVFWNGAGKDPAAMHRPGEVRS
jgi:hypothetical protein